MPGTRVRVCVAFSSPAPRSAGRGYVTPKQGGPMARWVVPMTRAGAAIALGAAGLLVAGAVRSPQQAPPAATQDTTRYEAPVDVDTAGLPGPRQPIFFRHDIHAGQYK